MKKKNQKTIRRTKTRTVRCCCGEVRVVIITTVTVTVETRVEYPLATLAGAPRQRLHLSMGGD
jgi:hypothetical protein